MDDDSHKARGAKGGKARAKAMTSASRSEAARDAALARWAQDGSIPRSLGDGKIDFAGRLLECSVLDTRLRVLTQETFLTTLGRAAKAKGGQGSRRVATGGLPPFLGAANLEPFISDDLRRAATPVVFRTMRGNKAYGYDAMLLPMVCEVYLKARDAHLAALKDAQQRRARGENAEAKAVLLPSQERLVETCDLLIRAMAKEHIIALVDRATGYQEQTVREEILAQILVEYIAPGLRVWTERFPNEFFRQVYKIHGWPWTPGNRKMPQYVGKFINTYVYDLLPPGVLDELQRLNPVKEGGHRSVQHHRLLTDTGNIHLDRQITKTITIMQLSVDKKHFNEQFWQLHSKALPPENPPLKLTAPKGAAATLPLFPNLDA